MESWDINLAHLKSKTGFCISNMFLLEEFTLGEKKKKKPYEIQPGSTGLKFL